MSTSAVAICNLALAHLGDEANVSSIDPPEGSAQADHCAQFYPMARDALLESHTWGFATRRAALGLLAAAPPDTWSYAYALPASCLKVARVRSPDAALDAAGVAAECRAWRLALSDDAALDFAVEAQADGSRVLYTNAPDAVALYVARVTDTSQYPPLFVTALARLLASFLAGPVIKGTEGMRVAQAQRQMFEQVEAPQARNADANARKNSSYDRFTPSSIGARA